MKKLLAVLLIMLTALIIGAFFIRHNNGSAETSAPETTAARTSAVETTGKITVTEITVTVTEPLTFSTQAPTKVYYEPVHINPEVATGAPN